ncbi:MAG: CoA-acylating methylmalonate-semialdehyde dehydrogenase, partial [Acidimicrobiia bacterium]
MRTINHWIDGSPTAGASTRVGPIYNPATGSQTAEVPLASSADVDAAVRSAKDAFETWRYSSLSQRQNIMFAFRELVAARKLDFAKLLTAEHGKTIDDALGEVQRGLEVVEFACNIAHLLKGEFSEQVSSGVDTYTIRQPVGVVAGITPFNFPAMVPMWMYPLAIACGNTFVLKPSEKDPSASMLGAELLAEAGLPEGVFNVIHGDKEAVDAILSHPDIAAISFVGSTPIARYIYENGTRNGKRVQALGGAKNHMIVLPDADIDLAADSAVSAGYGSAGERCMSISAVLTIGEAGDRLIEGIQTRIEKLKVGPGDEPGVEMGPLVTKAHLDRVRGYVDAGVIEGAALIADGRNLVVNGHEDGFFLGPTLFDQETPDMSIYTDEI